MRKNKVLFILNSLTAGGAEKQTISLVNSLDKDEFELGLVYLDPVDTLLPQIDADRLDVVECVYRKKRFDRHVIREINRLILRYKYNIVVCVGPYPLVYAFSCRLSGKHRFRILEIFHLTVPRPDIWTKIKNRLLFKHLMNRCEKIVFVCRNQMTHWVKNFSIQKDRSLYIYNGVDVTRFSDNIPEGQKQLLRNDYGFKPDDFVVGICAALRAEKKHTDFVDAIKLAREQVPSIKGLIVGQGPLEKAINQYIERNGLSATIKMTGFQDDTRPYVSTCDCMVLTSHAVETFSLSALESMAMAKPVIMTDLGGAQELVEHGVSGFIYEKGDVRRLAGYLSALAANKHADMGANARERVCNHFTVDKMIAEYTRLFSAIK